MRLIKILAVFLGIAILSGCATSTSGGAVGITRQQLLIVPSTTLNAQAALGYTKLSSEASRSGKLNSDNALTIRVRGVAEALIKQVGAFRNDSLNWQWEVNVFESDQLNAFCAPGGKIGIYSGLIRRLSLTDDELAAIMGHEIAHALREHSREKLSQNQLSNAVVRAIANSGSRNAGGNAVLAGVGAGLLLHLPFSREMELEADIMGLELMARAGYDPKQASNVWKKMQGQTNGGRLVEFFSTHPNSERRQAELDGAVPKVVALYDSTVLAKSPSLVSVKAGSDAANGMQSELTVAPKSALSTQSLALAIAHPTETGGSPNADAPISSGQTARTSISASSRGANRTVQTSAAVVGTIGQDSFQVERIARSQACNQFPLGLLTGKGVGYETYEVTCTNGSSLKFRCEFGNCVEIG